MRRTRHVVLPVRSWQYIGLLLVSLACVTFGLVARDREGQAGSLTGPELLHRAPHDVDVCPNTNPFAKSSVCLDLPENPNFDMKINEGKEDSSDIVRIDKRSIELDINRNELAERRHRTINERRISERSSYPMKKFTRSLERIDSKIENVGLSYRNSPNSEIIRNFINHRSHLSRRYSNDRYRSIERYEKHGNELKTERRNLENRELKERRHRFEIDTRRMIDSRSIERKEARGRLRENTEGRTIRENRKNVRERIQDRVSNSVDRREFKIEDLEKRLLKERRINEHRNSRINISDRRSKLETFSRGRQLDTDVERRNTRMDIMNRERRLSVTTERRNSLIDNTNRQRGSSISLERKNSRLNIVNRESQSNLDIERRHSRLDTSNRERRLSVDEERRNSRLDTVNRERNSNLVAERRNFRSNTFNHKRPIRSVDIDEHRNTWLDISKRDRRLSVDAVRRNSKLYISKQNVNEERRNSRLENFNRQRRSSLSTERRNSQLYIVNRERQSNDDVERRNSRVNVLNRERRLSINAERRNSRLDSNNHERRSSSMVDRTNTRITRGNRHDSESINLNSLRTKKSTSRDNIPVDQRDIRRENIRSEIRNIRFNSIERKQSGNRLEDQRFGRRMVDLEDRKLLDRRSRSIEQRNINALNRDNGYITFAKRNSRGEIVRTNADRSSESIDHREQRKIFLNRSIITPKQNRPKVNALKGIVQSFNAKNLRNTVRTAGYSLGSSLQLDRTRIERNSFSNERLNERSTRRQIADEISLPEGRETQNRQRRISKIFTPEISNRQSFITRKFHVSKQAERLSRSFDNINRLNSNERRESVENRRFRTNNDHSYSVLLTKRQDIRQERENLPQNSVLVLTYNFEDQRRLNTRIQERNNGRVERMINEKRRSSDSRLIGKEERLMVLRSRDQRRNIRSILKKRHNDLQIRYIDSLTRGENSDFDRTSKLIERSRNNADKRSSYRKLIDLRQSNSLHEKIRTSETSTQYRNTLLIPTIDHDRLNVAKNKENTRQFFDTNHKTQKIFKEFRNEKYGGKIGIISNLLKTNVLLDYNLSFEIIRQPFMIIICILYGLSMSKNNKHFTGNLMEHITKLVLR